jgi:hypothetical protein
MGIKAVKKFGFLAFMVSDVSAACRGDSPEHCFARSPSLPQAVKREKEKAFYFPRPLFCLQKRGQIQRSVDRVSCLNGRY